MQVNSPIAAFASANEPGTFCSIRSLNLLVASTSAIPVLFQVLAYFLILACLFAVSGILSGEGATPFFLSPGLPVFFSAVELCRPEFSWLEEIEFSLPL